MSYISYLLNTCLTLSSINKSILKLLEEIAYFKSEELNSNQSQATGTMDTLHKYS